MSKSLGLIQVRAQVLRESSVRAKAVQFLADAGKRLNSPRVSYLATRLRFDPFGGLRDSIDGMVGSLGKEKEDEIHHKDGCVGDFNENEKQTTERNEHKGDVEQEINDLESEIQTLNEDEKVLIQEIKDTQIEMKKASENREAENKDFQTTVADQRATQEILKKAVERLGEFYNKKALVQTGQVPGAAAPPPPPGFGEYKKAGGGGAMALIENIIAESASVEKDAIKAEQDAQIAYEEFIKDSNAAIKAKQEQEVQDEEQESKDKIQETQDEGDKRATIGDLLNLGSMNGALHQSCDFTYTERKAAWGQEIDGSKNALEILEAPALLTDPGFSRHATRALRPLAAVFRKESDEFLKTVGASAENSDVPRSHAAFHRGGDGATDFALVPPTSEFCRKIGDDNEEGAAPALHV